MVFIRFLGNDVDDAAHGSPRETGRNIAPVHFDTGYIFRRDRGQVHRRVTAQVRPYAVNINIDLRRRRTADAGRGIMPLAVLPIYKQAGNPLQHGRNVFLLPFEILGVDHRDLSRRQLAFPVGTGCFYGNLGKHETCQIPLALEDRRVFRNGFCNCRNRRNSIAFQRLAFIFRLSNTASNSGCLHCCVICGRSNFRIFRCGKLQRFRLHSAIFRNKLVNSICIVNKLVCFFGPGFFGFTADAVPGDLQPSGNIPVVSGFPAYGAFIIKVQAGCLGKGHVAADLNFRPGIATALFPGQLPGLDTADTGGSVRCMGFDELFRFLFAAKFMGHIYSGINRSLVLCQVFAHRYTCFAHKGIPAFGIDDQIVGKRVFVLVNMPCINRNMGIEPCAASISPFAVAESKTISPGITLSFYVPIGSVTGCIRSCI